MDFPYIFFSFFTSVFSGGSLVAQLSPTLVTPWPAVHGISQAGTLEWVPFPSSGDLGSLTLQVVSYIADRFFTGIFWIDY